MPCGPAIPRRLGRSGEDGLSCGLVPGGCVEAAVAAEAIEAIRAGSDRMLVLGDGSKFFDIVLPCGDMSRHRLDRPLGQRSQQMQSFTGLGSRFRQACVPTLESVRDLSFGHSGQ